ncbi:PREDICTED: uncharacterized protein LOC108748824 [Trachymyrmex septentrionalis]|uniref:uncharacterized protein LOC108748824 n=1 Tax=Trachymyrmex septentrionalis TaxID=34720 RepID=UPI00084F57FC|nr:PREDICTED: uncharacterized protein LOC108748824 [Trachymyrmex septentrionalis]
MFFRVLNAAARQRDNRDIAAPFSNAYVQSSVRPSVSQSAERSHSRCFTLVPKRKSPGCSKLTSRYAVFLSSFVKVNAVSDITLTAGKTHDACQQRRLASTEQPWIILAP